MTCLSGRLDWKLCSLTALNVFPNKKFLSDTEKISSKPIESDYSRNLIWDEENNYREKIFHLGLHTAGKIITKWIPFRLSLSFHRDLELEKGGDSSQKSNGNALRRDV